jgi:DNA-binding NarL/FixJ family response regulator
MFTNQPEAAEQSLQEAEVYLQRDTPTDQVRAILGQVAAIRADLSDSLLAFSDLGSKSRNGANGGQQPMTLVEPLSERELEVLRLVAAGASNHDIAETLVIAVPTVKKHVSNIFGKLGARSRTQAVAVARAWDLY